MEQCLKREKEILELTNSDFYNLQKVVTSWFSVKHDQITAHNKLVNAMAINPDFLILSRHETEIPKRRTTVYFNQKVEVIPYIPFGDWKLFDNTEQFGRYKSYTLQDPTDVIRTVQLTEYIPYLPNHLNPYLQYTSFEAYDKRENQNKISDNEKETKPEEITLEAGKSYLISIQAKY